MSVSGPSPLGTLMVQRVEAALGVTLSQQANLTTGARPDAITQPGQPDKVDPVKNPPPKEHEGNRRTNEQGGRHAGLAALARNDPEIAKLLAARNAPMTGYTASAPTTLGQTAKTILALLLQFPDSRPTVNGRAPLLGQPPGSGGHAATAGAEAATAGRAGAPPVGGNLDPRAIQALAQRAGNAGQQAPAQVGTNAGAAAASGASLRSAAIMAQGQAAAANLAPGAAAPAAGSPPPLSGMAGQLAMALAHALQGSGLFYEAHLREFAFGQRTLAQLRSEPQAQIAHETRNPASESGQTRSGAETAANQNTGQSSQASQGTQAAQTAQQAASAHLAGALLGLDPSTHALVRQQLETLANQSFAWQGEAWPGADLEWEVQRRSAQDDDAEQADSWATRLNLSLPGLGEVQARLSLSGSQIIMHLVSPDGAGLMADHTDLLRGRLVDQGLQLSQLTISRENTDLAGKEK